MSRGAGGCANRDVTIVAETPGNLVRTSGP
jgi:hypothetical protein